MHVLARLTWLDGKVGEGRGVDCGKWEMGKVTVHMSVMGDASWVSCLVGLHLDSNLNKIRYRNTCCNNIECLSQYFLYLFSIFFFLGNSNRKRHESSQNICNNCIIYRIYLDICVFNVYIFVNIERFMLNIWYVCGSLYISDIYSCMYRINRCL